MPKDQWIVIDEVQKVPLLLDEVHFLMERHGYKKFILTGSSARKIKRGHANLLAGRALVLQMFPLCSQEINFSQNFHESMQYGCLPLSILSRTKREKEAFLTAYVDTYLREEIKYEGLVRNLGSFSRFLEIAALCAGQQINMSNLSRDAEISRDTVRGYFSVFEDTLLGSWLPAYRPRAKVKEVAAPKFYWFDSGVLNASAGAFQQPMPADWNGILLEHWIHHELKSYLAYGVKKGSLGFWKTPSGSDIDFLWWYGKKMAAIEVKSSKKFKREFLNGIHSFQEKKSLHSSWVVYLGEEVLNFEGTFVVPVRTFLRKLHAGEII